MVELGNVAPLTLRWVSDPWGKLRPPLSVEAVQMSARLAAATYHMEVDPWLQAGWRDVTIQVDGALTNGVEASPGEGNPMQRLAAAWKLHRVRQRIRQRNPLGQVMGAFRQREKSDTGKVLVMLHPTEDGRYVVAISFMGTGERFYDWFSNFRMTSEGGVHKGFLQLTRQFEDNEEDISFPETAQELGLERLTLRHVLEEARNPNSRFILWLVGHSQGGALMQVYAHHKIHEDGVLPGNLVGYGFASPSAMSGLAVNEPSAYPLYHVLNSDDVVPRMGAQVHLGVCLIYPADDELRRRCYNWSRDRESVQRRQAVGSIIRRMTDTPACIEVAVAYLNALDSYTPEDILDSLGAWGTRLPLRRIVSAADARVDDLLRYACRHMAAAYLSICGEEMAQDRVAALQEEITALMERLGVKRFTMTMKDLMGQPHRIGEQVEGAEMGAYPYIALHGVERLVPAIWRSGRPPVLVRAARALTGTEAAQMQPVLLNRRMLRPERRPCRRKTCSDPRRRSNTRRPTPTLQPGSLRPGERIVHARP